MLKTALLILTLGEGGTMQMALTTADTMQDCKASAQSVEKILTGAGYTIEAMRCGQTDIDVAPYEHGQGAKEMRWQYHVTVQGDTIEDGFQLRPIEGDACSASGAGEYCTVSAQEPLSQ